MNEDAPRTMKDVLAAILVSSAYQHGDLPADDYAALEVARTVLASHLPGAVRQLTGEP